MKNGQNIGYVRVSSVGQNDERQLQDINLDRVFKEKVSGKNTDRPQLKECIEYVRNGDTLHVHSMDRLARNLIDLQKIIDELIKKGVIVHFHKENLIFKGDNNSFDKLLLQVIGAVSEFERNLIKERQKEGIENAKIKGVKLGRKNTLNNDQIKELKEMVSNGINKVDIGKHFGISRQSVYTYIKQ